MKHEKIFTGKTVELALADAAGKLGIPADKLSVEVIEKERAGFLGIGAAPAKIRVSYETPDPKPEPAVQTVPEVKPEPAAVEKSEPSAEVKVEVKAEPLIEAVEAKSELTVVESVSTESAESESEAKTEETVIETAPTASAKPARSRQRSRSRQSQKSTPKPVKAEEKPEVIEDIEEAEPVEGDKPTRSCGDHIAKAFIETLLADLDIDAQVTMTRTRKSDRAISVNGEAAGILIGHHGDTLDALQYLANLAANKREEDTSRDYVHITVDVENYRAKREAALRSLANRMAAKVKKTEKPVMLEPMTPYERRIIHSEIQNIEGVSTNSVGTDANRRVVVYLESAGFSLPAGVRADKLDSKPTRSDGGRRRNDRGADRRRSDKGGRGDRRSSPAKVQPMYNDGEKMSAEEVNELVATYGARDAKEEKRDQPAKFKSFEDYMNSILGEDK